jgi:hypothetical protein
MLSELKKLKRNLNNRNQELFFQSHSPFIQNKKAQEPRENVPLRHEQHIQYSMR